MLLHLDNEVVELDIASSPSEVRRYRSDRTLVRRLTWLEKGARTRSSRWDAQLPMARDCDNCSEELEFEEKTDLELGAGARDLAIRDLKKKLASKKMAVALKCGQHAIRHYAVMQFPYYQRVVYLYDGTINVKIMVSAV